MVTVAMTPLELIRVAMLQAESEWVAQGRTHEQQYAVRNFLTGRGDKPLLEAILEMPDDVDHFN